MRQWIWTALVQIMDCHLFGTKLLSKLILGYCQMKALEQASVKFESKYETFLTRKCIRKRRLRKTPAILSKGSWVKRQIIGGVPNGGVPIGARVIQVNKMWMKMQMFSGKWILNMKLQYDCLCNSLLQLYVILYQIIKSSRIICWTLRLVKYLTLPLFCRVKFVNECWC